MNFSKYKKTAILGT